MTEFVEGWNHGNACAAALGYTEGGTPYVAVLLRVNDGDNEPNAGRTITTYLYLTDAAGPNTAEALRLMGFRGSDVSVLAPQDADIEKLLPREVSFPINYEEHNGKRSPKVGKICASGGGSIAVKNRLEGNEAKSFGMRFRALFDSVPATGGAPKPAQAAQSNRGAQQKPPASVRQPDPNPLLDNDGNEFPF